MNKLPQITKESLLILVTEEKERFNKYSQLCAQYQITTDPIATAKYHGKMEILQRLLQDHYNLKI